jgi:hypothetical protein
MYMPDRIDIAERGRFGRSCGSSGCPGAGARRKGGGWGGSSTYSDGKVANRDTRVWHGATDNAP